MPPGTWAVYRCRAGLEPLLVAELGGDAEVVAPGRVAVTARGPLAALGAPRLALSVGLGLPAVELGGRDPAAALAELLASPAARALFALWGGRPARFRLAWAEGKHRAATHRVALALAPLAAELLNDPRGSDWEVLARVGRARLHVELEPRGLLERRFGWRVAEVQGASHPTVAAALARVGAPGPGDRVWDPFVGSALELCECWLLVTSRASSPASGAHGVELWGTDLDAQALEVARRHLDAVAGRGGAGARVTLLAGDATAVALPGRPTLVITNPPWGGRVGDAAGAAAVVRAVLGRVGRELAPGGRMAWVARDPRQSDPWVAEAGLVVAARWPLDLGGIHGELQRLTRPAELAPSGGGRAVTRGKGGAAAGRRGPARARR